MLKIAAIQMNSSSKVAENLKLAEQLLIESKQNGTAMAVLPENFSQMPLSEQQRLESVEDFGSGPIQDFLSSISSAYKLWIIAGSISLSTSSQNKVYSSCLVYDDQGECRSRYDKQHLFDVDLPGGESYKESSCIQHGDQPSLVDTPLGRVGLSICYDLRFPEYYRLLTEQGAELITAPSAFTYTTGKAHWETLLRARAIEDQVYVIAPAQTGTHDNGRTTYGHTVIFDPWGERLALLEQGNGVAYAEVDPDRVSEVRSQIPCLKHRRM